ncbi:ABI family member 3 binding protein [Homo sapiens]|uniref:ABI family member 3 binding protein n=2 Tax=Homininae TaxID=207598 RepID=E9PRB5_HUMAN|nr:ABI family member 3 binding protein [Homo sapiens]KAI4030752.1 ABI family member 3 binding protein [Homo sapiens]
MLSSLGCLLLCGSITLALGNAQKLPKANKRTELVIQHGWMSLIKMMLNERSQV